MNMLVFFSVIIAAVIIFTILNKLGKAKHPFKKSILTMLSGVCALIAVNILSGFTMVSIPISTVSLLAAIVGGIPGVTLILALNTFF